MKNITTVLLTALMVSIVQAQNKPKAEFNMEGITQTSIGLKDGSIQKWEWILKPELDYKLSKKVRFYLSGRFYTDLTDNLEPNQPELDEISNASQRYLIGDKS